eukprot:3685302-Rhodomonas_salina.1
MRDIPRHWNPTRIPENADGTLLGALCVDLGSKLYEKSPAKTVTVRIMISSSTKVLSRHEGTRVSRVPGYPGTQSRRMKNLKQKSLRRSKFRARVRSPTPSPSAIPVRSFSFRLPLRVRRPFLRTVAIL